MAYAPSMYNTGILNGKTGICIYFYHLGRLKDNDTYTRFAETLLDDVIDSLALGLSVDFRNGITGIGWAIEHFIQNGFIEGDADEILQEIDEVTRQRFIHAKCSMEDILSIGYYWMSRISYRAYKDDDLTVLDIKYYIILMIDEIERQVDKGYKSVFLYDFLTKLYELDIFNFKVERLLGMIEPESDVRNYPVPFMADLEYPVFVGDADFSLNDEQIGLNNEIVGFGLWKIYIENGL